jgi:WD40 repeat protein
MLKLAAPVAAGKMIRCPKCKATFRPQASVQARPPEVEERTAPAKSPPAKKGIKTTSDRARREEDEEETPRRRRSDDSDPDIRPRKKRSKENAANPVILWISGGVVGLALIVGGVFVAVNAGKKKEDKVVDSQRPPGEFGQRPDFPGGPGGPGFPGGPGGPGGPFPPGGGELGGDDEPLPGFERDKTKPVRDKPVRDKPPEEKPPVEKPPREKPAPKEPPNDDPGPPDTPKPLPDAKERPYLSLDAGGHTAMARAVLFTPNGKLALTIAADKTVRVWDVATGETVYIFHVPVGPGDEGALFSGAISREGLRLAVGGYPFGRGAQGMPIYLINLQTGKIERTLLGNEGTISDLTFSPDGLFLASAGADGTARIFEVRTGRQVRILKGHRKSLKSVAFSPDSRWLATTSHDETARVWNVQTSAVVGEMKGHGKPVNCSVFTHDSKAIITGSVDPTIRIWELNGKQRQLHPIGGLRGEPVQVTSLSLTRDGKEVLYTGIGDSGVAGMFNLTTGQKRIQFKEHNNTATAGKLSPDGTLALTHGGDGNETFLWRTKDGSVVHKLVGKGKSVWAVAWREDGKAIAWGNKNAGPRSPLERAFVLGDLDFGPTSGKFMGAAGSVGKYTLERVDFYRIAIKLDGQVKHIYRSSLEGDRIYSFSTFPGNRAIMGGSFGLYLVDLNTGKDLRNFQGHSGIVTAISPSPDGRLFMTGSADQTICILHPDRAEPLVSLFVAERDWIAWTPEGYYASSAYGERLMGWLINNGADKLASYFPAVRFRASLYQPDAIRRIVRAGSVQRALELVARDRKKPVQSTYLANVLPPEVSITSPAQGDLKQAKVTVKATAHSTGNHPVTALRLLVDGRPWQGVKGARTFDPPQVGEVQASWEVELPPGKHDLVALADSGVSRGMSAAVEVTSSGEGADLPNLYVLAMGISAYSGKLRLNYAASDAALISKSFQERSAGVFKNVQVKVVTDREATRKGIIDGLAWLASVMTPRDVTVISFSGHGARDPLGSFYLVPVDVNPRDPRTLLSGDLFKEALANLPGKVVCLLDACHSGSVAEDEAAVGGGRADDLVRDLVNDEYGVVVMCSSLGSEYSLESAETRAGFFTLAIVEGLGGKADLNGDSIIYMHELDYYAGIRVQQLSRGQQTPTTGKPPGIRSFPLSKP